MAKAKSPRVFVPLIKVDEEQRLVYGRITRQEEDQSGEVMDYATSKPHFEKWSAQIEEASGGLSKGNVRVMHGLKSAGKLTDIEFDDDDQSIEVCAKIVDDGEWEMVKEGCYTGFSVGGRYGKKWKEGDVQKFTAVPNEVSLVDNPCVKSATFTMLKADGAEEEVKFKSEDEEETETTEETNETDEAEGTEADETTEESTEEEAAAVEKSHAPPVPGEPSNADVVAKAEELAKAADNGTTWMQHVEAAREELMKAACADDAAPKGKKKKKDEAKAEEVEKAAGGEDFTVLNRLSQKWVTSDGQSFEKKADAEAHEEKLIKAAQPKTEAEKLRDRLNKAIKDPEPEAVVALLDDYDRLGKVYNALSTPFGEDGQPVLEKGMYTVERFARVLWDLGKLTKSIAAESAGENDDNGDKAVAAAIKAAMGDLGESFKVYVTDQIDELLMGIDDEAYVCYYDYYYAAAKEEGENELAKDVCSLLETHKDSSRTAREGQQEELVKAFGIVIGSVEETEDDLSPPMRKRFDDLEADNTELRKVAGEAIEKVEELAKRLSAVEESPAPRAPNQANIAFKDGDGYQMFGKKYGTQEDLIVGLDTMLKTEGPEAVAMKMIRAAHSHGGHKLDLAR
jgi:hypothetical protein